MLWSSLGRWIKCQKREGLRNRLPKLTHTDTWAVPGHVSAACVYRWRKPGKTGRKEAKALTERGRTVVKKRLSCRKIAEPLFQRILLWHEARFWSSRLNTHNAPRKGVGSTPRARGFSYTPPPNRQIKICAETPLTTAGQTEYTRNAHTHTHTPPETAAAFQRAGLYCNSGSCQTRKWREHLLCRKSLKSWQTKTEEFRRRTLPCGWQFLLNIWALALIIQALLQSNPCGCWETHWQSANKSSQQCYHTPCFSPPSFLHSQPPPPPPHTNTYTHPPLSLSASAFQSAGLSSWHAKAVHQWPLRSVQGTPGSLGKSWVTTVSF